MMSQKQHQTRKQLLRTCGSNSVNVMALIELVNERTIEQYPDDVESGVRQLVTYRDESCNSVFTQTDGDMAERVATQVARFRLQIAKGEWQPHDITKAGMIANFFTGTSATTPSPWVVCQLVLCGKRMDAKSAYAMSN